MKEITSKLPWTLGLVGVTTVIAFVIGTLVGIVSAWRRGGRIDSALPPTLVIVSSVPVFFIGLLLLYTFAVKLAWLPLGSKDAFPTRVAGACAVGAETGIRFALGSVGSGVSGFRRTHEQSLGAQAVALPLVRLPAVLVIRRVIPHLETGQGRRPALDLL